MITGLALRLGVTEKERLLCIIHARLRSGGDESHCEGISFFHLLKKCLPSSGSCSSHSGLIYYLCLQLLANSRSDVLC